MKTRIIMILLAFSAAVLAQPALLARPAAAQTYGESLYGGGVYEDPRTALEADQSPSSNGESVPVPDSDTTNPPEERDAEAEQESSMDHHHGPGDVDEAQDSSDENPEPVGAESKDSDSISGPHLLWQSLAAIAAALFLALFAVLRRRRTQD